MLLGLEEMAHLICFCFYEKNLLVSLLYTGINILVKSQAFQYAMCEYESPIPLTPSAVLSLFFGSEILCYVFVQCQVQWDSVSD